MMTEARDSLLDEVSRTRLAIREHRDQVGDYRCWVADEVLYHSILPELRGMSPELPDFSEFMKRCEAYHAKRQDPSEPARSIPMDSSVGPLPLAYSPELDADLVTMSADRLREERDKLWEAIRAHRASDYENRDFNQDKMLYLILPEKRLATTQLPPRELFISGNCPAYATFCQENRSRFATGTWERKR